MNRFFITGYPRSRTAWLANFLTYKDSFCFHDGMEYCEFDPSKLPKFLESVRERYIGNSDSSILYFHKEIYKEFPLAKFVLIEREFDSALDSLESVFGPGPELRYVMRIAREKMEEFKRDIKPLTIKFEDLEKMNVCKELWEYCIPDIPFNPQRWVMLDKLEIVINPKQIENIRRLSCQQSLPQL